MQTIVYRGSSDFRELSREDFEKLGIEHFGMTFRKGEPVEVSNEAYGILMGHDALTGDFAASDAKVEPAVEPDLTALVGNPGDQVLDPEDVQSSKAKANGDDDASAKGSSSKAKKAS